MGWEDFVFFLIVFGFLTALFLAGDNSEITEKFVENCGAQNGIAAKTLLEGELVCFAEKGLIRKEELHK